MNQKYKVAIPISGGFDSTVSYLYYCTQKYLEQKFFFYHVDYGQPYLEREESVVKLIEEKFKIVVQRFHIDLLKGLELPTIENENVGGRNLLIMYIGALRADSIVLSAPDGDMHPKIFDKNKEAVESMSVVLTKVFGETKTVTNILFDKTKTNWAFWIRVNYGSEMLEWVLKNTYSCHSGELIPCGVCKPCFRKWVQLRNLGMDDLIKFNVSPVGCSEYWRKREETLRTIRTFDFINYSKGSIAEIIEAIWRT